jgi:hypothetical protein
LKEKTNWSISKKIMDADKIIGCYLFNEESVYDFLKDYPETLLENIDEYKTKSGIQGLALCLLEEYRGSGLGRNLRKIPTQMNYDYIWGQHFKSLKNVNNWIKFGRRIIADGMIDGDEIYVTLMDLS